jgi:hypothetical protein
LSRDLNNANRQLSPFSIISKIGLSHGIYGRERERECVCVYVCMIVSAERERERERGSIIIIRTMSGIVCPTHQDYINAALW